MIKTTNAGPRVWPILCGLTLAVCALGCASAKRASPASASLAPPSATNADATALGSGVVTVTNRPPPEGYAWDDLARMAAANSAEAKALLLEADAERHQTAVDTGWRNPQLRSGWVAGEEDETQRKTSGVREWDDRDYDGYTAGLRIYVANPFVNRWLRKRGAAAVQALEAQSEEVKYALYCEVKSLCLEAEVLRSEIGFLEKMSDYRKQLRDVRGEQTEAGVSGALELVRAETRLATLRSDIREKQAARQRLIRRIAVLAGVPAEHLRLRPLGSGEKIGTGFSSVAVLTDLAFLRRPDLRRTLHEKEAAAHALSAARAKQIPWFEYVEGTYDDESGRVDTRNSLSAAGERTDEDKDEWQARFAVTVPVFNWLGDEVRLNRSRLAAAESRLQGLYDSTRREIDVVWTDYCCAAAERDRVAGENKKLNEKMSAQIDALASEPTVRREDVIAIREELVAYQRASMKAEYDYLRLTQELESVCGGSLANAP